MFLFSTFCPLFHFSLGSFSLQLESQKNGQKTMTPSFWIDLCEVEEKLICNKLGVLKRYCWDHNPCGFRKFS